MPSGGVKAWTHYVMTTTVSARCGCGAEAVRRSQCCGAEAVQYSHMHQTGVSVDRHARIPCPMHLVRLPLRAQGHDGACSPMQAKQVLRVEERGCMAMPRASDAASSFMQAQRTLRHSKAMWGGHASRQSQLLVRSDAGHASVFARQCKAIKYLQRCTPCRMQLHASHTGCALLTVEVCSKVVIARVRYGCAISSRNISQCDVCLGCPDDCCTHTHTHTRIHMHAHTRVEARSALSCGIDVQAVQYSTGQYIEKAVDSTRTLC